MSYNDMPMMAEFPTGEMSFRVSGDVSAVLHTLNGYMSDNGMLSTIVLQPPQTFVVTSYLEEPSAPGARRVRRTAFRIKLSEDGGKGQPTCTYVSLSSLTKSRGVREETWTVAEADKNFELLFLPKLRELIKDHKCGAS